MYEYDENGLPKGYNKLSGSKKNTLKNKFFDGDYNDYIIKKKATQKKREKIAKIGATGVIIVICTLLWIPSILSHSTMEWIYFNCKRKYT